MVGLVKILPFRLEFGPCQNTVAIRIEAGEEWGAWIGESFVEPLNWGIVAAGVGRGKLVSLSFQSGEGSKGKHRRIG